MASSARARVSTYALLTMTVAAVFNFRNVISNSVSIGLASAPAFFFATLLYFLPYTLIIAELVALNRTRNPATTGGSRPPSEGALGLPRRLHPPAGSSTSSTSPPSCRSSSSTHYA